MTVGKAKQSTKPSHLTADFVVSLMKKLNISENKLLMTLREFQKEGVKFDTVLTSEKSFRSSATVWMPSTK